MIARPQRATPVNAVRRVLLADDEPLLHQALARNLRRRRPDWVLEFAGTGAEAVERSMSTRFDAIVLDQRMPGISGIEAACEIRRQRADAACVMLTGFADLATVIAAINDAGIVRFLSKPCPTEVLIGAIEAAFAQHDRMLPQVAASRGGEESPLGALALERLPFAALRLTADLVPLEMNAAAMRLLADGDVLVRDGDGALRVADPAARRALEGAARRTRLDHVNATLRLKRGVAVTPLAAILFASPAPLAGAEAELFLFIADGESRALPAAESLMAFFELTAAEARLVHALIRGLTLQEASVEQALTLSSARTYLRHVFGKLGVTRQAELMRRVLTSPVMFVDDAPQMRRAVTSAS
jgi:DNA-binding NarL/FixJ family response regulator